MIQIYIPDHFVPERKYAIHILLDILLKVDYNVTIDTTLQHTKMLLEKKCWIFKDSFFDRSKSPEELYKTENLPTPKNGTGPFKKLLLIYGENAFSREGEVFTTGFDIISSVFFMATRWEEMLGPFDQHDRFLAKNSISFKFNFLHRPVLHEYSAWLKEELTTAGLIFESTKAFKKIYTCDVDYPFLWDKSTVKKKLGGFVFKKILSRQDPYFVFDEMMDDAEKENLIIQFNFLSGARAPMDNYYDLNSSDIQHLFHKIIERGHEIGLHGSYNSYNDISVLRKEKKALEDACGKEIIRNRQHFLRFNNPKSWQIQNEIGLKTDSTMGFADQPGFRSGLCVPFPVFDIIERKMLSLKEQPLILMDATLRHYLNVDSAQAIQIIDALMNEVRAHGGEFVFLWHNSSFYENGYNKLLNAYQHLLKN